MKTKRIKCVLQQLERCRYHDHEPGLENAVQRPTDGDGVLAERRNVRIRQVGKHYGRSGHRSDVLQVHLPSALHHGVVLRRDLQCHAYLHLILHKTKFQINRCNHANALELTLNWL